MEEVEALTGYGIKAGFEGRTLWLGNEALMKSIGASLSSEMERQSEPLVTAGKTIIWVAMDGQIIGLIALADTPRNEIAGTIQALAKIGITHTIMLTGDHASTAASIAAEAGITDFRADLMPEGKLTAIKNLVKEYGQVAMVGDGVNDAPALANATVGIAMGGSGTDAALETADVALMGDDLAKIPYAVGIGRAARRIITENLALALGVIVLLVTASLTGLVSIGIAVVIHESSTLLVVLNSLRLLGYRGPAGSSAS